MVKTEGVANSKTLFLATGILAIVTGALPFTGFMLMGQYGYPELIRESPQVILSSLYQARSVLPYLYYAGVGGAGLGIIFLAILLGKILAKAGETTFGELGKYCGMINGLCLYGGILRWTFLFPKLAEFRIEGSYDANAIDLVFKSFNTYVGDTIAEHVGFTFMFLWILFFCIAILKTGLLNRWIAIVGMALGALVLYGNTEFFGAPGAFMANRLSADLVALWIVALGIVLIAKRNRAIHGEVS
jgi:hypothetical protein